MFFKAKRILSQDPFFRLEPVFLPCSFCCPLYRSFTPQTLCNTQKVLEKYTLVLKKALTQFLQDSVNERLAKAQQYEESKEDKPSDADETEVSDDNESRIVTTEDELQGFYIVKGIVGADYGVENIQYKDYQGFFTVYYQKVSHKICKFYFNKSPYSVEIFDTPDTQKVKIEKLEDLYGLADRLKAAAKAYVPADA